MGIVAQGGVILSRTLLWHVNDNGLPLGMQFSKSSVGG